MILSRGTRNPLEPRILMGGVVFAAAFSLCTLAAADEIHYESAGRRDPFIPLVGPGGAVSRGFNPEGLSVEGIIYDPPYGSLALINGEFYQEGATVQKANVISIFKDRVILAQGDEEKTLWVREEIVSGAEKKNDPAKNAPKN